MRKVTTLKILLFISTLAVVFLIGYKYLSKPQIDTTSEKEYVWDEKIINLKGIADLRKLIYENDKAIIKFSYNSTKEYFLQEIKKYKDLVVENELYLTTGKYEEWQIGEAIKNMKITIKEGEDFMDWLESQNNSNEINITNPPHNRFLKDLYFEDDISIFLGNGEVEVFDRVSSQNVKFISYKGIRTESYHIKRFYLPSNEVFFERSYPVIK